MALHTPLALPPVLQAYVQQRLHYKFTLAVADALVGCCRLQVLLVMVGTTTVKALKHFSHMCQG